MKTQDFVAIDFETMTPELTSACAIGLVRVHNGVISQKFYSLIKPIPDSRTERNTHVHGLTDEMRSAITSSFEEYGTDANGDGQIIVQLREYVVPDDGSVDEDMMTAQLTADINSCESFFFLMENAESFQYSFGLLRFLDGTLPSLEDYSVTNKIVALSRLSAFSDHFETLSPKAASFLGGLTIGVRGFWTEKTCPHLEECEEVWDNILESHTDAVS